jgi:hypothetical protein
VSFGLRRGSKPPDKLFEALRKAQAFRDAARAEGEGAPPPASSPSIDAPASAPAWRPAAFIAALLAAAAACAALAWQGFTPD